MVNNFELENDSELRSNALSAHDQIVDWRRLPAQLQINNAWLIKQSSQQMERERRPLNWWLTKYKYIFQFLFVYFCVAFYPLHYSFYIFNFGWFYGFNYSWILTQIVSNILCARVRVWTIFSCFVFCWYENSAELACVCIAIIVEYDEVRIFIAIMSHSNFCWVYLWCIVSKFWWQITHTTFIKKKKCCSRTYDIQSEYMYCWLRLFCSNWDVEPEYFILMRIVHRASSNA